MGDSYANYGILIRSDNSSDRFKGECISQLLQICKGGIARVVNDTKYDGFRIYFKNKASVTAVLNRRSLTVSGHSIFMYPLITHLTIHNVDAHHDVQKDLYEQLQSCLGSVLNVSEVPLEKHPEVGSGNWRAVLEIPEAEDLEVFRKKGLPNEMFLKLPYLKDNLKVTFFCSNCKMNGHVLQKCTKQDTVQDCITEKKVLSSKELNEAAKAELLGNVQVFASQVGEEEVKRHSEEYSTVDVQHSKRKRPSGQNSGIDLTSRIKIELEDTVPFKSSANNVTASQFSRNNSGDDVRFDLHPKASSTTADDDEIQVLSDCQIADQVKRATIETTWSNAARKRNSEDDRNSLNAPTSSQPETVTQTANAHSSNTAVTEPPTPTRRRAPPVGRIEIPPNSRVEECIREAGGKLSKSELEAFFQHVKKKGNVSKIARQYTDDVKRLKEQLSRIVHIYYHSPLTGTKQDRVFMKWLQQLVERFDGVPVSRRDKKGSQNIQQESGFFFKSETEYSSHSFASEGEA
ncbi:uncharacterized protein LOC118182705 [Stegodyphus dumicola]|uniref:uncharacterized protein LOC118182705 n=1 Tax=Stegodyphus dumicola TaxID=202533 RepID=UPI0015ABA0AA|nr:uncharacterized protein LOC118182705 [Stegodyphus dumicola]